jgi:hypothetical protein
MVFTRLGECCTAACNAKIKTIRNKGMLAKMNQDAPKGMHRGSVPSLPFMTIINFMHIHLTI